MRDTINKHIRREEDFLDCLRTAAIHFVDAQIERASAIRSAHRFGLSIRQIAAATDLSRSRVHRFLNSAHAMDMSWVSQLSEADEVPVLNAGRGQTRSTAEIGEKVAEEVKILRHCIDWLARIESGESVAVSLRQKNDAATEYVPLNHARVGQILEEIASNLDGLLAGGQIVSCKQQIDPARARRGPFVEPKRQAEKPYKPKKLRTLRPMRTLPPK
jgi:hypothetical protein